MSKKKIIINLTVRNHITVNENTDSEKIIEVVEGTLNKAISELESLSLD